MKSLFATLMSTLLLLVPVSSVADYDTEDSAIRSEDPQDIVITFNQDLGDLKKNGRLNRVDSSSVARACLALTLAQLLRNEKMNGGNDSVDVAVFVRNDGVKLADPDLVYAISNWQERGKYWQERACKTPDPNVPGEMMLVRLDEHLDAFLNGNPDGNPDLVNCPICWCEYRPETCMPGGYSGYPGVLDPTAIPALFLGSEKVIDF